MQQVKNYLFYRCIIVIIFTLKNKFITEVIIMECLSLKEFTEGAA
jgi:hypothetical protein